MCATNIYDNEQISTLYNNELSDWYAVDGTKLLVEFQSDSVYSYWGYKMNIECLPMEPPKSPKSETTQPLWCIWLPEWMRNELC